MGEKLKMEILPGTSVSQSKAVLALCLRPYVTKSVTDISSNLQCVSILKTKPELKRQNEFVGPIQLAGRQPAAESFFYEGRYFAWTMTTGLLLHGQSGTIIILR